MTSEGYITAKTLQVMDPMLANSPRSTIEKKHIDTSLRILRALFQCLHECYPDWAFCYFPKDFRSITMPGIRTAPCKLPKTELMNLKILIHSSVCKELMIQYLLKIFSSEHTTLLLHQGVRQSEADNTANPSKLANLFITIEITNMQLLTDMFPAGFDFIRKDADGIRNCQDERQQCRLPKLHV